jgi:hypothetical protein
MMLFVAILGVEAFAQEENKEPNFFVNGYLKNMFSINDVGDSSLVDNLIHNRLNFRWYPHDNLYFYGAIRTRLYIGDSPNSFDNFVQFIEYDSYRFDLSWTIYDEDAVLLHSEIDRFYLQWSKNKYNVKIGRQRINWGINSIWNPNDIFNAYSYFDFDYEERPGTDAARVEYFTGTNSSFDFAINYPAESTDLIGRTTNIFTTALMWKTNKWNYDFQFMGGYTRENYVAGLGWAGNLKSASFKGELSYFYPVNESVLDPKAFVSSVAIDHTIGDFFYSISYLYNSAGPTELGSEGLLLLSRGSLTAKNLSPYKHSGFIQGAYQLHPLWNAGLGIMLFPPNKVLFLTPFVTWNILQNLDFDFIVQAFYGEDLVTTEFKALSKAYFFRVKWSF